MQCSIVKTNVVEDKIELSAVQGLLLRYSSTHSKVSSSKLQLHLDLERSGRRAFPLERLLLFVGLGDLCCASEGESDSGG